MIKLSILFLTLLATIPASPMRVSKQVSQLRMLAPNFAQRGYALMSKQDINHLVWLRKNGYPLGPKEFVSELSNMPKDKEDLERLWKALFWEVDWREEQLHHAYDGRDCWEDGSAKRFDFINPYGALSSIQFGSCVGLLLLVPSTVATAGLCAGGEVLVLLLKALQAPEALEIVHSKVHVLEKLTLAGVGTTAVAGTLALLNSLGGRFEHLQRFSYDDRVLRIYEEHLKHVTSLLEQAGGEVPFTKVAEESDGWRVITYEPTKKNDKKHD